MVNLNEQSLALLNENKIALFWDSLGLPEILISQIKNRATNIYVTSRKTIKESILEAIDEINRNQNKTRQG